MGMISFFEMCGGIPTPEAISADRILLRHADAMTVNLQTTAKDRKPAPPLVVAMVVALEMVVNDESKPPGHRALAFMRLVKTWTAARFSDLQGMKSQSFRLTSAHMEFAMERTKTTGAGKKVQLLNAFVSKEAYIVDPGWVGKGLECLHQLLAAEDRDYFMPSLEHDLTIARRQPMSYGEALALGRALLTTLRVPVKGPQGWIASEQELVDPKIASFWSEHSERHVLTRWATIMQIPKEDKNQIGRWCPSGADQYVSDARVAVLSAQKKVATSLRKGVSSLYDEDDIKPALEVWAKHRGLDKTVSLEDQWRTLTSLKVTGDWAETVTSTLPEIAEEESDGFGDAGADSSDSSSSSDEELQIVSPFWAVAGRHRLHSTNNKSCTWNPHRISKKVCWFKTLAEAQEKVTGNCRRCFPSGGYMSDEDSQEDGEDIIDPL
jgi:hypothetical protein